MLWDTCHHVSGPTQTVLLLSLFKTKVSDRAQDGLKLSNSDSSSLDKGEKQRNQKAKFRSEATNRFAVLSSFS